MRYWDTLQNLHGTAKSAAQILGSIDSITGRIANSMGRRNQRISGLGGWTTSGSAPSENTLLNPVGTAGSSTPTVTKQTSNTSGGTTTTYSDGTVIITNAAGQDVTSNFIQSHGTSTIDNITSSIASGAQTAASNIASGAQTVVSDVTTALSPIIMIGVIGIVAFLLLKEHK